ncbi:MAG TPA: hypothetical protein VN819_01675 [Thermoplasmata archaeon]|nr:hypothetical protein [Thermoplasmata archaeon]
MTPSPPTLWDTRQVLLGRLSVLGASNEVLAVVRQDSYSLAIELGGGARPDLDRALGVLAFLEERAATAEEYDLAVSYLTARLRCATRLAQQTKRLGRFPKPSRERYVREVEQRAPVPMSVEGPRVVGPGDKECAYGPARSRQPGDGPDEHYLRDYRWEYDFEGIAGALSLPCVACAERHASDPCAPGCSVPGGRCSADWFRPTPPQVLGPYWPAFQRSFQSLRREIATDDGRQGARYGKDGKYGRRPGGRPKSPTPDAVAEVVSLLLERGVADTRLLLEDRDLTVSEREHLIREASRKAWPF